MSFPSTTNVTLISDAPSEIMLTGMSSLSSTENTLATIPRDFLRPSPTTQNIALSGSSSTSAIFFSYPEIASRFERESTVSERLTSDVAMTSTLVSCDAKTSKTRARKPCIINMRVDVIVMSVIPSL